MHSHGAKEFSSEDWISEDVGRTPQGETMTWWRLRESIRSSSGWNDDNTYFLNKINVDVHYTKLKSILKQKYIYKRLELLLNCTRDTGFP